MARRGATVFRPPRGRGESERRGRQDFGRIRRTPRPVQPGRWRRADLPVSEIMASLAEVRSGFFFEAAGLTSDGGAGVAGGRGSGAGDAVH
jgi:hypothetical protein